MKKPSILSFVIFIIPFYLHASSECHETRDRLVSEVVALCSSYKTMDLEEDYYKVKSNIDKTRMLHFNCERSIEGIESNGISIFTKSLYVLSQVRFYLRLREARKTQLELWSVESQVVSKAVENDCKNFASAVNSD